MDRSIREHVMNRLAWMTLIVTIAFPQFTYADDLTEAINKARMSSTGLIESQKKDKARLQLQSDLKYDQLNLVLHKGVTARKTEIVSIRDHFIRVLPDLPKKQRVTAEQTRQALESWVQALPSINLKQVLAQLKTNPPKYVAITDQQVAARRAAVNASLSDLKAFLNSNRGDYDWNTQLQWDGLVEELAKDSPNLGRLDASLKGFYGPEVEGLELPVFTQMRTALRAYMNAVYFSSNPQSEAMYTAQVDRLAVSLENYLQSANNEYAWQIGRVIGWLERADQATQLRNEIRYQFYQPNIYFHVSQHLVSSGEKMEVDETEDVSQVVKGVPVKGTATMKGQISFEIAENSERATLNVMLDGTALSKNVAKKSGVTVVTNGTTTVHAEKSVSFDENGFTMTPSKAEASTKLELESIDAPSSGYESIARTKFIKGRSGNEEAASQLAVDSVTQKMDARVLEMLADVRDGYQSKVRNPLIRRGGFPVNFVSNSTKKYLYMSLLQTGRFQIAAASEPPALDEGTDVAMRLHESFVRNFTEVVLGGVELTDEKLVQHMTDLGAEIPEELKTGPGKKSWAITFSKSQPISVGFRDNQIVIAIQGQQFRDGNRVIREMIRIAATYDVEKTETGMRLQREGDVKVDFLTSKTLTVGQVATKTVMSKKFNAFFKDDIVGEGGITLPGKWENAGNLLLRQLVAENGWLMLSYNLGKPSGIPVASE